MLFANVVIFVPSTGLGFRPLPPEDNVESTLIWYRGTNKENFEVWTNALDEFLSRKYSSLITSALLHQLNELPKTNFTCSNNFYRRSPPASKSSHRHDLSARNCATSQTLLSA